MSQVAIAMINDWYEKLRCPKCGKTGMPSVVRPKGRKLPAVESVPLSVEPIS
jgi:hypothetical protein